MRHLAGTVVAAATLAVACAAPPEVPPELRARVSPAPTEADAPAPASTPTTVATPTPAPTAEAPQPPANENAGWVTVRGQHPDRLWRGHLDRGEKLSRVEWQIELEGHATASPLVDHDGTTYVATTDPPQLVVVSADGTATTTTLPDGRIAPVAVSNGTVVLASTGALVAVETATSDVVWSVPFGVVPGYEGRVAYSRGVLYLASQDRVAAVALDVGVMLWSTDLSGSAGDTAGICISDDEVVCVAHGDDLIGLDAAEGHERWRTSTDGEFADTVLEGQTLGSPTADDALIVASGSDGGRVGVDPDDGTVVWESEASASGGSATNIFTFVQTDRTVVAWSGDSEFWRRSLVGHTLTTAPVTTLHHVLATSSVAVDRHEYAYDTVVEAFDITTGEPSGSVTFTGSTAWFRPAPGPSFVVAVTEYADTVKDVSRHLLTAFS